MEHLLNFIILIMSSLGYTDGLCPVGYKLKRDTLPVGSTGGLIWSKAATECSKRNGRIVNVRDNRGEQGIKNTMDTYSLTKAWIEYSGDIKEKSIPPKTFYIMKNIEDRQFTASSYHKDYGPIYARVDSERAWIPWFKRLDQWIQVDLKKTMCVHGIVTQGKKGENWRTTVYKLHYRREGDSFLTFRENGREILSDSQDRGIPDRKNFTKPFNAQFVRIYPQSWKMYPAIRFDLLVSNNTCPTDFTCGKCPAMVKTTEGTFKVQNEPCCSELPHICETWSCDQADLSTDYNTTNSSHRISSAALSHITPDSSYDSFLASNHATLIIGLMTGMVSFLIISIILLILLLVLCRRNSNGKHPLSSACSHHYDNTKTKRPNLQDMAGSKDSNTHVIINNRKSDLIYSTIDSYDITNKAKYVIKDEAVYDTADDVKNVVQDPATYLELYRSHRNAYNSIEMDVEESICRRKVRVKNCEIPDGIEMIENELYSDTNT